MLSMRWRLAGRILMAGALFGLGPIPSLAADTVASPSTAPLPAPTPSAPAASPIDPSGDWELRWDRTFAGWQPAIFEGKLSLQRDGARWNGQLAFRQSGARPELASLTLDGDRIDIAFSARAENGDAVPMQISGWIREDRLIGELRWGTVGWTPLGGRRIVLPRLVHGAADHSLASIDVATTGIDARALDALLEHAAAERSSAIVLVKDGRIAVEMHREGYDGSPLFAMSASKSVVSLAVGMLIADGKLSLDTRMGALVPGWKGLGKKSSITVRQLLTHVSGLDPGRANPSTETIRETALAAKLLFPPGTRYQYNNGAVDFLAVVVRQAAGVPLDEYLETRLFRKLDIVGAEWMKDKEGTPRGAGELMIRPVDLAKLGQLMLDGGAWRGEQLLPAEWVAQSIDGSQPFEANCGLLWWREGEFAQALTEPVLAAWRDLGVDKAILHDARGLVGRKYGTSADYSAALAEAVGPAAFRKIVAARREGDHIPFSATVSNGSVRGFSARGWLGQFLVVLPKSRIVAVRMRKPDGADYGDGEIVEKDAYRGFADDVARLVPEPGGPAR